MIKQLVNREFPLLLAPLAGVSDSPFRSVCYQNGADLCYVEMLSATALNYRNKKTLSMMRRDEQEPRLGVQLTAADAETMAKAVEYLNSLAMFETIDINMGCPVNKVVKAGCGSALLKDAELVYGVTKAACQASSIPVSVKIRLGWDHQSKNYLEVASAIESAGAKWLTVHGRTRSDDYSQFVDLSALAQIKRSISIPLIGNGNLFSPADVEQMRSLTMVDGVMISRGSLGNPWIFRDIKASEAGEASQMLSLADWWQGVSTHIDKQASAYQDGNLGAICMRKHLLWYVKGWPGARKIRQVLSQINNLTEAKNYLAEFVEKLSREFVDGIARSADDSDTQENRFNWDPKWQMDRELDRGVGDI
ncbi:MAG: tRNA dihydrouridine synthase DusB [Oligoflexales bacterium]|nr:tRNA dihydrouridine synthase DusB [Oligoflexales bacterium]